jgi:hypothetical protein
MSCDVDFSDYSDDAEPVQFYDERMVVGRKDYECIECKGQILKGTRHLVKSYRFEGTFNAERTCGPCQEIAGEFEHRIVGGFLWDAMGDAWDNGARVQACINRLATADAKAHLHQRWQQWFDKRAEQQQRRLAAAAERKANAQQQANP